MPGTNLTREEAQQRAGLVTAQSYLVDLDFTTGEERFAVTTAIKFSCVEAGASSFVDLISEKVTFLQLNGEELDVDEVFADSRIHLSNLGATNELIVKAEGEYSHTGEGLHRFVDPADGRTYLYSQCETADARRIFPCFEQPDMKARFTFCVVTPPDWIVISNQPTPDPTTTQQGSLCWSFDETPIMSTYLAAVIAGPYRQWSDTYQSTDGRTIPLGVYVRESMAQHMDADNIIDITRRGFEFFEKSFKIPYPYEKYDQVFVPQYNFGAMENIGAVTLTEDHYIHRSKPLEADLAARANTILHEQAHMWFGDMVTMVWWDDLWLNESFAEFMAHYASVNNTRWVNGWTDFNATRKLRGYAQDQLPTTHPIMADIRDLDDVLVNFDMITYAKGASVLKQLVAWVGEDAFLAGVHNYLTKYAESNATLIDFLAEIEATSGQDLQQWSRVWLQEAGVTTLSPIIEVSDGTYTRVSIAQEPAAVYARFKEIPHRGLPEINVTPSLRPHKIQIAGYDRVGDRVAQLWSVETIIDGALSEVEELSGKKVPDLLLINDLDLTFAKVRLDETSRAALPELLPVIDDSLVRALIWSSLWDSVRDGDLAPSTYINIALSAVTSEKNSMTLMSALTRLHTAVRLYVAKDARVNTQIAVADQLLQFAEQVTPGSDQQLQFFKAGAVLAANQSQWDQLAGVYSGGQVIPGLVVDTEVRWDLLTHLVANGQLDSSAIDEELARDNTLSGRERAEGVQAALPTPEAKRAAWRRGVLDDTISNATQRRVLAGLMTTKMKPELLREFVGEYFSIIEQVWETRTNEMRQNIVNMLYPLQLLDDTEIDVLEVTDQWLDDLGARLPALRRLILANREEIICARLARQADTSA
jgi:aminopeptidase N